MPPARRLVRRRPLWERITSFLDPRDMLLWLSEEIETREWNSSKTLGTQLGIGMSIIFMLARANSGGSDDDDDLFADDQGGNWVLWITRPIVWVLSLLSVWNAFYTLTRVRNYRLFEVSIDRTPETPSVKRVKVQSEPASSSPLRFISSIIATETAESRAHPDKTQDVWELSVWDPLPLCLRLFCLFSPGHVFAYWLFLPLQTLDPYPSLTSLKCIMLQVIISGQLYFLQSQFSQQVKDTAVIHREVLHEYDTKFVHPRLHPVVRDAGTQVDTATQPDGVAEATLYSEHGTPTTLIKRGFQTHPNPNYSKHIDPDGSYPNVMSPRLFTPSAAPKNSEVCPPSRIRSSVQRQSLPAQSPPVPAHAARIATGSTNFGGSMGVYTHANSPLKKATSLGDMNSEFQSSPRNSREMAAREQRREGSPSKGENRRLTTSNLSVFGGPTSNPFANARQRHSNERYPTRWS